MFAGEIKLLEDMYERSESFLYHVQELVFTCSNVIFFLASLVYSNGLISVEEKGELITHLMFTARDDHYKEHSIYSIPSYPPPECHLC